MTTDPLDDIADFEPRGLNDLNKMLLDKGQKPYDEDDPLVVQLVMSRMVMKDMSQLLQLHHKALTQLFSALSAEFEERLKDGVKQALEEHTGSQTTKNSQASRRYRNLRRVSAAVFLFLMGGFALRALQLTFA